MSKAKIGRNDPCPCGSGLKFKKCHLGVGSQAVVPVFIDAGQAKIYFSMAAKGTEILDGSRDRSLDLQRKVFGSIASGTVLEPEEAEPYLKQWLSLLEAELKTIASTNSRYFWLFLSQRIAPSTKSFDTSDLTVHLYRKILKLAILKYGQGPGTTFTYLPADYDVQDWAHTLDSTELPLMPMEVNRRGIPQAISWGDVARVVAMQELAYDYWSATSLLRRVWKGGQLPIADGAPENVIHDPETEWLIDVYDGRLKYGKLLSEFGSIVSPTTVSDIGTEALCLIPVYNVDDAIQIPLAMDYGRGTPEIAPGIAGHLKDAKVRPNFVVQMAGLSDFRRKAERFGQALTDTYGFPPDDLVCFLVALAYKELKWWSEDPSRHIQLFMRGYTVNDPESFTVQLTYFFRLAAYGFGIEIDDTAAGERVEKVISLLTYQEADLAEIDLWTRSGSRLILPHESGYLVDFTAIPDILIDFFQPLAKEGGTLGNLKGEDFEREVAEYLVSEVTGAEVLWRGQKLGDERNREIDLGVLVGDTFFALECKAHALDPAFERGEYEAVEHRRQLNVQALNQIDERGSYLAKNPKGAKYELPAGARFVLSAALSPYPEYIHERSERFFLDERIPRVCTPEEMAIFLKSFSSAEHQNKSWLNEIIRGN
jgi:hypothetical protein